MAVGARLGLSLSRVVFILVGAGYTGTILLQKGKLSDLLSEQKGKLSDLLAELQGLLKGNGKGGDSKSDSDPVTAQIQQLAMEVRKLDSARPITVFNGDSRQNSLSSLVVPTADIGALGYGYMKWKGITFSDLMYVTKRNMAAAVTNMTKHLADITEAVAATKKHLTQQITKLDTKMDEQVDISKLILTEILGAHVDITEFFGSLDDIEKQILTLSDKMGTLDEKQTVANIAVLYLAARAHGEDIKLPQLSRYPLILEAMNTLGKLEASMNLEDVLKALEVESNSRRSITDGISRKGNNNLNDKKSKSRRSIADVFSGDGNNSLNAKESKSRRSIADVLFGDGNNNLNDDPRALFRRPSLKT